MAGSFRHSMLITNPVYIIGAGPNGVPFYDHIPRGVCALALNGAAAGHQWTGRVFGDVNCYRYDYYYQHTPGELRIGPRSCGNMDIYIPDDCLAFGSTVVGTTLRWLHTHGGNCVILVGVDMFGGHWDGTSSGQTGTWGQLPRLQQVIDELSSSGMVIKSLSHTELNVELVDAEGLQTDTEHANQPA